MIQPVGRARTFRGVLEYVLLASAATSAVAAGFLAWFHLTQGPPAQRVHIRWAPTVSASERTRVERLLMDPRVEDTFHIDRAAFRVQLDRPELSPRARAWLESDRLGQITQQSLRSSSGARMPA